MKYLLSVAAALLIVLPAWGYESIDVKNGGSIKGIVKIAGPLPKDDMIQRPYAAQYAPVPQ